MDYEKEYKEALERARQYHKVDKDNTLKLYAKGTMEYLFPVLKEESEDERIRKEIISALKFANVKGVYDKHIAWLEKQGEDSVCKVKIGETFKCIASPRYTCFRTGDIYHVEDNFVAELINTCSGCFVLLEKQGEQKTADKVEPKFHEGEWVTIKE